MLAITVLTVYRFEQECEQ